MKICLVSSGSGSRGGGEIYLTLLAEGLKQLGHEVETIVPDQERMDELASQLSAHARVHRIPFTATYDRKTRVFGALLDRDQQKRMTEFFKKMAPDIIHVNQQVAEDGLDLVLAAQSSGLPWVSTIHVARSAKELGAVAGAARDFITRRAIKQARGLYIAVSDVSRDQLAARFAETGAEFATVHNGTKPPEQEQLERARRDARAAWGVADNEVVIGSVGRIEAQKNPLGFIDAVASLPERTNLRCVWIGDGSLREEMENRAGCVTPSLQLHIDGWRDDASLRMAGFDIFFLPSLFEGLPFAVVEAMHAGLPIIASSSDGLREAIEEGSTGFLCVTPDQFSQRLETLVNDAGLRARLGKASQAKAQTEFTLQAMAQKTLALYRGQIEARGSA